MDSGSASGSTSTRRGFLRHLVGGVRDQLEPLAYEAAAGAASDDRRGPRSTPAARALPAAGCLTIDDALRVAEECRLGGRLEAVRALAARSIRLTLCEPNSVTQDASWLGERQARPNDLRWTGEREPRCLAVVDLAQAATVLGDPSLPAVQGKLWCFATENARAGPDAANSHEYPVVVHQEAPTPAHPAVSAAPTASPASSAVHLSAELQLPRVWSESVQALELDGSEHQGWQRLREQLAERQGVQLHDEAPDFQVLHRLFGYPDERRGDMPLACELLAQGHVLGTDPPWAHPHASAAEPHAARWRLLLQLSIDDQLGWAWGGRRERLYVWIDRHDLAAGDFTRVQSLAY